MGLWRFWYWRGHLGEGRRWLTEALALADSKARLDMTSGDDPDRIAMRIRALIGAGMLASAQDDYDQALALMETSLEFQRKIQDKTNLAATLVWLGSLAHDHGDDERSQAFYSDGLTLCRELGPAGKRPLAFALNSLGEMAWHQGDHATALSYHEESLMLWRELDSKDGMACALHNLGLLVHDRGNDRQATAYLREGLSLAWELKDKRGIAEVMAGLAIVAGAQGQTVRAAQLFGQIENILALLGYPLDLPDRTEFERNITALRGQLGEAAFQAAWTSGQAMTLDQAVAEVLTPAVSA